MATISNANFLSLADNVAKTCVDLESAFITNPGTNAPTLTTISNGIANLQTRVAGLNDLAQESALSADTLLATNNATAYLTFSANTFYALYTMFMWGLEQHVNGAASFITTGSLMVHPEFSKAFNYFASNASSLGITNKTITPIPLSAVFVPAEQSLATIAVTGAAAGTYAAGTNVDTTKYSSAQALFVKNTGGAAWTAGMVFSITYKDVNNATQTVGYTSTAVAAGATVALSVNGQAVTNITVTSGGVNGASLAVTAEPTRAIAY